MRSINPRHPYTTLSALIPTNNLTFLITTMGAGLFKVACLVVLLATARVEGAGGACGKLSPDKVAVQLAPCAVAARNAKAAVSSSCCLQVKRIGRNPKCLCAVLLSPTAKAAGVNPQVAITIPKRCRFANRPVGFKCGPYTLPWWVDSLSTAKMDYIILNNCWYILIAIEYQRNKHLLF